MLYLLIWFIVLSALIQIVLSIVAAKKAETAYELFLLLESKLNYLEGKVKYIELKVKELLHNMDEADG